MTTKLLLANDPGSVNYGYALVEVSGTADQVRFRVRENGLCPNTIKNMKDVGLYNENRRNYIKWLQWFKIKYQVDAVCAERFMTRGISGPTVESVNQMIGMLGSVFEHIPLKVMPAATWKNAVTRAGVDLKELYKVARVTPHQLDACLIGIYTGHAGFGLKDFGKTSLKKVLPSLLDQIEDTSTERLINRKQKR